MTSRSYRVDSNSVEVVPVRVTTVADPTGGAVEFAFTQSGEPSVRGSAAAEIEAMSAVIDARVPVDVAERLRGVKGKLTGIEAADLEGVLLVVEVLRGAVEMRDDAIAALEARLAGG